jgi:two-component system cell cycle response regulator
MNTAGLDVLLIENDPKDAEMLKAIAAQTGHQRLVLHWERTLKAGEKRLASGGIDVILLELLIPHSDGMRTLNRLQALAPEVPLIVLSSSTSEALAVKAVRHGAEDFLIKDQIQADMLYRVLCYAVERHRYRVTLMQSEARFHKMINQNMDAIVVADDQCLIQYANPAAATLLNREVSQLIGTPVIFPLKEGSCEEIEIQTAKDKSAWTEICVVAIDWAGKRASLASLRDITARKRMAQSLEQTTEDLKATVSQLSMANKQILQQQKSVIEEERLNILLQMAGATAHELNQPLMSLLGNIELMRLNHGEPAKFEQSIDRIEEAGQRIADIVKKIQTIRRDELKPYLNDAAIINLDQRIMALSVEDSGEDYQLIRTIFENNRQVKVTWAQSVAEGIHLLQQQRFDIVFLDYLLPDGNGLDFLRQMQAEGIDTPVVVITGQNDEAVAAQLIQAGAYDYLPKGRVGEKALWRIILNTHEKFELKKNIRRAQEKLDSMPTTDELTGLYNQHFFIEAVNREISRAQRYGDKFSLGILGPDNFQQVRHDFGQAASDAAFSEISRKLTTRLRRSDLLCRFAQHQFAILAPRTAADHAKIVMEDFRKLVQNAEFKSNGSHFQLTLSGGVALYQSQNDLQADDLIARAQQALAYAQSAGRNRVVIEPNG